MTVKDFLKNLGVEPDKKNPAKTVNIDLGGDRIFRYSGKAKQVEIDSFNPFEVRVKESVRDIIDQTVARTVELEQEAIAQERTEVEEAVAAQPEPVVEEAIAQERTEVEEAVAAQPEPVVEEAIAQERTEVEEAVAAQPELNLDRDLRGADLRGANLKGVDLAGRDLQGANLTGANLTGADLRDTNFKDAYLPDANLQGANLSCSILTDANLIDANLQKANLTGANLVGANLKDASLQNADLRYADLGMSSLDGADFSGAQKEGTVFTGANIADATGLDDVAQAQEDREGIDPPDSPTQSEAEGEPTAIALAEPAGNISSGVTHNQIQARVQEAVDGLKARAAESLAIAANNIAETTEKAKETLPEPVVQILDEVADKVPAAAIALVELHDSLKEPAREWLMSRLDDVRESGIVQQLPEKGGEFVRASWEKVQQMGQDVKKRAIADSVVALTKEFGEVDASKQFVYKAEDFTVKVEGLNQYHVEDRNGQEILSFKYDRLTGPKDMQGSMSFADQVSFVQAGGELTRDRTVALAGATGEKLQQLTTTLGNLAPAGTKQRLETFKQQQVSAVAQMMLQTSAAVEAATGKVFNGERFKFVQESGAVQIFKNGMERQEKVFEQLGQTVRSRMEKPDVQSLITAGKAFIKAHSAARAKASQQKESAASQR